VRQIRLEPIYLSLLNLVFIERGVHADAIVRKAQDSSVPLADRAVEAVKSIVREYGVPNYARQGSLTEAIRKERIACPVAGALMKSERGCVTPPKSKLLVLFANWFSSEAMAKQRYRIPLKEL
jgi:hypothetical protein